MKRLKNPVLYQRVLILFITIHIALVLRGQESNNPFFFTFLSVENGLSQQTVNAIFQDTDGYMWFGTRNGLNRYDGYDFKVFRKNYYDEHSLCGNEILCITQDSAKDIWIGTIEGINRIDYKTGQIFRYLLPGNHSIEALFRTSNEELLFFTDKANWIYDRAGDSLRQYRFENLPEDIYTRSATEDSKNNLYLGTSKGLYIYDHHRQFVRHIPADSKKTEALPDGYVSFLTTDREGKIWIVSSYNKVSCWDPERQELKHIDHLDNVRQLLDYNDSTLLAGTFHGLALLHKRTLQPTYISMNIGEKGALSHFSVLSLYQDNKKNLWVGTYSGGVNYHSPYSYKFHYIPCRQFTGAVGLPVEDSRGNLWFATEGNGLLFYNPATRQQQLFPIYNDKRKYSQNIIKSTLREGEHILCTTHNGQVFRFSTIRKTFQLLYDYQRNDIQTLYRDSRDRLWIPTNTNAGLVVMDNNRPVPSLNISSEFPQLSPLSVITEINKGQFLLGTLQNGLVFINETTNECRNLDGKAFGFSSKDKIHITAISKDPDGKIWVSTNGAGLFCFNNNLELLKNYNRDNGLTNECIYNLINRREEIWLTTSREIFRLNKNNGQLDVAYSKSGLIPQEFTPSSSYCSSDGIFYLPASNGFLKFTPTQIHDNQEVPQVLLTTLSIGNQQEIPGKSRLLKNKLQLQKQIVLSHNQTNLTIQYTAPNYLYPEQTHYAYRLEGVDENWNYVGNRRAAIYNNLKPGEYKFSVIASNNRRNWNNESTQLTLTVLPPLWFRWWAWCSYGLIVIFTTYKIVKIRHRKHELEASLLRKQLEQKKLEEINQERLRFFTRVTHEFRTPLTLIINLLDDLNRKFFHIAGMKEILRPARKNTERLLSLVNSLMDIQKQNSVPEELKYTTFDFIVFLREMLYSFQTLADQRNIHLQLKCPHDILAVSYDRKKLEQLFFNLLSNACKFTPPQGSVTLSYELLTDKETNAESQSGVTGQPSWLQVHVSDTGTGIPKEQIDRIFDPFCYSGKDLYGEITGSGIGLSITKLIAEQHGGTIHVTPVHPQGTDMKILLPYHPIPSSDINTLDLISEQENIVSEAATEIPVAGDKRYKILVVEDNRDILSYLRQHLSPSYHIITAGNGQEALETIQEELPDMIVSDIMMPGMSGLELCRLIKKDIRLCHILFVLLTARSMSMQIEEGFEAGADEYIVKPFRMSLLQSRIRNLFANREQLKGIFSKKFSLENLGIEVTSIDETFVKRYIEIVRHNFTNPNLDVNFICQEMGMSRANFYKKLHTVTDLSPMDMVRNIRLESAAQLLRESQLTISEITTRVGFNSNSYFSSCFKALFGVSPKTYQTNCNKGNTLQNGNE